MAGTICLFSGYQRSGKTLLAMLIAESYHRKGIPVYTNMNGTPFYQIEKLSDLPFNDYNPKVLLLDELHFFLNARNFKSQADFIYFLNTICKRNILFLGTTITLDMIDKNLRTQINYLFMSKKTKHAIHYRMIDVQKQMFKDFNISFANIPDLQYQTLDIPKMFTFDIANIIQ